MELLDSIADPDALADRADALIGANRLEAARGVLSAARRIAPDAPRLASLAARLDLREGRPEASLAALTRAIDAAPSSALFMLRADARRQIGDLAGAAVDAADAVIHDRNDPAAKALLGVLLLELGRGTDAIICLKEAVAASPANPAFREAFAKALDASGQPGAAAATFAAGIAAAPGSLALRNGAILMAVRQRAFATAVTLAEDARKAGIADACTFGLKGHALSSLGQHEAAAEAYEDAFKLGPEDPYVRHLVAAAGVRPGMVRAPSDYVRTVFDGYAERFEAHLISLRYRVPGLMHAAVRAHLPVEAASAGEAGARIGPVLDLGCGTGLVAVALSDMDLGPVVGVDLSPRMLEHAAAKRIYTELHESDIVAFLEADARRWRLVLAADVFCYSGALEPALAAVYARLLPGGVLVFSAEALLGPYTGNGDWVLGRQGRYAHSKSYLARVARAAGFVVRALNDEEQRQDGGGPVHGFLMVLARPNDAV
jgi:predicted TPR repeat methyltransferase